jgi:UDP-N-acetylglucosamine 1-carboxyvinyltransferase
MQSFVIHGGQPLYGSVRLGGAKNASFKLMIAGLLGNSESRLLNFSRISEVSHVGSCIQALGGKVEKRGARTLFINPQTLQRIIYSCRIWRYLTLRSHVYTRAATPL